MPKNILLVEDDPEIAQVVALHLEQHGFTVTRAARGREALAALGRERFDLVVLDLMLPDMDGMEICRQLRAQAGEGAAYCPVLVLTARSGELDRILGLELGADDYVTKPFSPRELVARVKALLRRVAAVAARREEEQPVLDAFDLHMDPATRRATVGDQPVELTATEFDLLYYLAARPGRVFSRAQLLEQVWGYDHEGYEHTVNSHINRLRGKIEPDPSRPRYVRTVRGVGYKFPDRADWQAD